MLQRFVVWIGVGKALVCVGVVLALSAAGSVFALSRPVEKASETTMASYKHLGEFTCVAYSASVEPSEAPLVLFPQIISSTTMLFAYTAAEPVQVTIKAFLGDKSGNWQKEVAVNATDGQPLSFPLDLGQLLALGNTISTELGGRGNGYTLKIVARIAQNGTPFEMVLQGQLDPSMLVWDGAGLTRAERGFPGGKDWVAGAFGYSAALKPNALYGPVTLTMTPQLPAFNLIASGSPLLTSQVESLDIGYVYGFSSDAEVRSVSGQVSMDLVLGETDRWTRTFPLLASTPILDTYATRIPLDVAGLREMAEAIDEEMGGRGAATQDMTISTKVHVRANTDAGIIDEIFTQQLTGKIGDKIELGGAKSGKDSISQVKAGKITRTVVTRFESVPVWRAISLTLLALSVIAFGYVGFLFWQAGKRTSLTGELRRNRKTYGGLISEVSDFPACGASQEVIDVPSLEALINISNNSLKPALVKVEPRQLIYRVIDGQTVYEHTADFS
jgi:hypothetical protein